MYSISKLGGGLSKNAFDAVPGGEVWSQEVRQPNYVGQEQVWHEANYTEPTFLVRFGNLG